MAMALMILILAFGPEPPAPAPKFDPLCGPGGKPVPMLYQSAYAKVLKGETIFAAVGVDPEPGEYLVAGNELKGEFGHFKFFLASVKVCYGDHCEIVKTPMMERIVPQVMPSRK